MSAEEISAILKTVPDLSHKSNGGMQKSDDFLFKVPAVPVKVNTNKRKLSEEGNHSDPKKSKDEKSSSKSKLAGTGKKIRTSKPSKSSSSSSSRTNLSGPLLKCFNLLKDLSTNSRHQSFAQIFYFPVDPIANNCPDYLQVIKKPMDLWTMKQNMLNNLYTTPEEFAADVRLMISNCFAYNPKDHPVIPLCERFQSVFENRYNAIMDPPVRKPDTPKPPPPLRSSSRSTDFKIIEWDLNDEVDIEFLKDQIKITEKYMEKLQRKLQIILEKKKKKELEAKKNKRNQKRSENQSKSIVTKDTPAGMMNGNGYNKKNRRDSKDDEEYEPMTYEDKRQMSLKINQMQSNDLYEMINIVIALEPNKTNLLNADEFELDFDNLKPKTMMALKNYVNDVFTPKAKKRERNPIIMRAGKLVTKGPINEIKKELDSEKKQLEEKLKSVENQLGIRQKLPSAPLKSPPRPPVDDSSSSSDSDSSSSSSSDSDSSSDD